MITLDEVKKELNDLRVKILAIESSQVISEKRTHVPSIIKIESRSGDGDGLGIVQDGLLNLHYTEDNESYAVVPASKDDFIKCCLRKMSTDEYFIEGHTYVFIPKKDNPSDFTHFVTTLSSYTKYLGKELFAYFSGSSGISVCSTTGLNHVLCDVYKVEVL